MMRHHRKAANFWAICRSFQSSILHTVAAMREFLDGPTDSAVDINTKTCDLLTGLEQHLAEKHPAV